MKTEPTHTVTPLPTIRKVVTAWDKAVRDNDNVDVAVQDTLNGEIGGECIWELWESLRDYTGVECSAELDGCSTCETEWDILRGELDFLINTYKNELGRTA